MVSIDFLFVIYDVLSFFIIFMILRVDITTRLKNQSQKACLSQEQIVFISLWQQTRTPATKAATELGLFGHGKIMQDLPRSKTF